jgi:hypothetical protein
VRFQANLSRVLFAAAAALLVVLRSWAPTVLEGYFFDADQAIVGLMALHVSRLQHFPLYYYGLHYLLGVQAWIIAIAFAVLHPSVAVMRLPLVALNVLVAIWLIAEISRSARLRPAIAFVAVLPFLIPTPAAAAYLVEAAGASIEPFVYILLLWHARRRPFALGLVLAFGTLHREFTLFALPALLLATIASRGIRPLLRPASARFAGWTAAGAALVWLVVNDLKLRLGGGSLALQAVSLGGQICGDRLDLIARSRALVTQAVPTLFGGLPMPLSGVRLDTPVIAGSSVVGGAVLIALAGMAARTFWLAARGGGNNSGADPRDDDFGLYLAGVGACAAAAYPLSCSVIPTAPPLMRYLLLVLLLPIGLAVMFLRRERRPLLRTLAAAMFVSWAGFNLYDNVSVIRSARVTPPLNERRVLTDYLTTNHVRYARGMYWDAYVVDFMTAERVTTASVDLIRIPEYQQRVDAHSAEAVELVRLPCSGGVRIASWCVISASGTTPRP